MPDNDKTRRATIHDVAREAGVSAATVSKVLRSVSSVKQDNADRVHRAVAALGYRQDPLAAGLRKEQRRIIGAVVPDLESPFFGALVTWLERAAEQAGYHTIVATSRECETREADLVERMNDWRVAGTVLAPVRSERGAGAARLKALDMRAVLVDRVSVDDRFDTVTADNVQASAVMADKLIGLGHSHVLLLGATRLSKAVRLRVQGFCERANSLNPALQIDTLLTDGDMPEQRAALDRYFATAPRIPTAVFSLSQNSTLLVLSELRKRGLRIPQDVALAGFDNADWMHTTWPSITAIAQPVQPMAERAIAVLLARLDDQTPGFPVQYLEPCKLLGRESTEPVTTPVALHRSDG